MSGGTNETRPSVISSLFGVVGRELQQFVLSAAGVNPVPSTSQTQQAVPTKTHGKRKAPATTGYTEEIDRRQRKRARTASPERFYEQERRRNVQSSPAQPSHDYEEISESGSDEASRSPTPVRRRATSVMPGSLFERSPTATPEPETQSHSQEDRHVRFASAVKSPAVRPPRRKQTESPSPTRHRNDSPMRYQEEAVPFRRDKSERSRADAPVRDTFMDREMLPRTMYRDESQFTDLSSATPPPSTTDSDEVVYVRHSRHHHEPTSRRSTQDAVPVPEAISRIRPSVPHSLETRISSQSTQSYSPTSLHTRSGSREEYSFTSASERSFDQQRISELEQEVKRLRDELSRASRSSMAAPPPPPPPPPPLPLPSRIPTQLGTEKDKGSAGVLMNARASLKATPGLPVKAVNPSAGMKSTVPADQMAAFLTEMKTVRLRKVASKPDMISGTSRPGLASLGSSFTEPLHPRSFSQASTSTQSAGSSFATSSISPPLKPQAMAGPSRRSDLRTNRIAEPTPSLCSDIGDFADEERPPSTPPSVSTQLANRKRTSVLASSSTTAREDVEGETESADDVSARRSISRHPAANASNATLVDRTATSRANAFPNRPVTSEPLPSLSPNKPRPKGRVSTNTQAGESNSRRTDERVVHHVSSDDDDDPLSMITPSHPVRSATTGNHYSRHTSQQPSSQAHSEHHTHSRSRSRARTPTNMPTDGSAGSLEAELKKVIRAEVEREFEAEIQDLNAEAERYLSGHGKRSSQGAGFMKGGGGAGEPVWMGNGSDHGVGSGGHLRAGTDGGGRERTKGRSKHRTRD